MAGGWESAVAFAVYFGTEQPVATGCLVSTVKLHTCWECAATSGAKIGATNAVTSDSHCEEVTVAMAETPSDPDTWHLPAGNTAAVAVVVAAGNHIEDVASPLIVSEYAVLAF